MYRYIDFYMSMSSSGDLLRTLVPCEAANKTAFQVMCIVPHDRFTKEHSSSRDSTIRQNDDSKMSNNHIDFGKL